MVLLHNIPDNSGESAAVKDPNLLNLQLQTVAYTRLEASVAPDDCHMLKGLAVGELA